MIDWISVEERLPVTAGKRKACLVWRPDDPLSPYKICTFYRGEFQNCIYRVTHWAELEPPEVSHD